MNLEDLSDGKLAVLRLELIYEEQKRTVELNMAKSADLSERAIGKARTSLQDLLCDMSDVDEEIDRRGKVFGIALFGGYPFLRSAD